MFKKVPSLFAKMALPVIIDNLVFKARTVEKESGFYMNVFVSVFGVELLDTDIKLSSQNSATMTTKETLTLDDPIDVKRTNQLDPWGNLNKIAAEAIADKKAA